MWLFCDRMREPENNTGSSIDLRGYYSYLHISQTLVDSYHLLNTILCNHLVSFCAIILA